MFGLAIWDDRARTLVLARDRAGEKPLFWTERAGEIRFASEIQALLAYPDQPRRVHRHAAELYAALGYVPAPHTMFASVEKLRPGELLIATAQGVTRRRYWDPAVAAAQPSRLTSPAALRETLLGAVRARADVRRAGRRVHERWARFVVPRGGGRPHQAGRADPYLCRPLSRAGYDESAFAEAVTHDIKTVHHVVTADDAALSRALDVVTRNLAEPVGDPRSCRRTCSPRRRAPM